MERNSNLEHLWDFAMPRKKPGLMKRTDPKPMSKKQAIAQDNRDKGKTSLRKANEVPGAADKKSVNRMQLGGLIKKGQKGVVTDVTGNDEARFADPRYNQLRDEARLQAYNARLRPSLAALNPTGWNTASVGVDTVPSTTRRLARARQYQTTNVFPQSLSRSQANNVLGADSTDYNKLATNWAGTWNHRVQGANEAPTTPTGNTRYGLLNYAMAPKAEFTSSSPNFDINSTASYDIPTKKYSYKTQITKKTPTDGQKIP
jgi:hypothetical protein